MIDLEKNSFHTDSCIKRVCALLHQRVGVVIYDHQQQHLKNYLDSIREKNDFQSCSDYLMTLEKSSDRSPVFEDLIAAATVGESYFFRMPEQMRFLREHWFPKIIAQKEKSGVRTLRIWSAGCSNGQEIYSIAIMIKEFFPELAHWNIHLLGTDINPRSLAEAVQGVFSEWSFRSTEERIKRRYFQSVDRGYELIPDIRNMVQFSYHNLIQDHVSTILSEFFATDLILCRNVFIYFEPAVVKRVVRFFKKCLLPESVLLLGPADFVPPDVSEIVLHQENNMIYYQFKESEQKIDTTIPTGMPDRVAAPTDAFHATSVRLKVPLQETIDHYRELSNQNRWRDALALILTALTLYPKNAELKFYEAKLLANLGRIPEAFSACEQSIQWDSINPHTHLFKAILAQDLNRIEEARQELQRVLFLDPSHLEALYHLGMLMIRKGQRDKGIKNLQVALGKVKKKSANEKIDAFEMTFGEFAAILENEIRIYEQIGT